LYYWPTGARKGFELVCFIEAYQTIGYEICADGSLDPSCDKIVLYADRYGFVHHVARQLPDGKWTSKLGPNEDIIHDTPECLACDDYGHPACFMHRHIQMGATVVWS